MNDKQCTKSQFRKRKKKKRHQKTRESIKSAQATKTNPNQQTTDNTESNTVKPDQSDTKLANGNKTDSKHITTDNKKDLNHSQTDSDEEEDDDLSFLAKLKETKTVHKLQFHAKHKGLVFEENAEFTSSGLENPDSFKHDPSREFGESFSAEKAQDDKLKTLREQWVEKQMRQKLLEQGRILPENEKSLRQSRQGQHNENMENRNHRTTLQEELYAISDQLVTPLTTSMMRENDEAGERWLAGMTEYELPLEYKLKNIKQTEDAKRKLLQPKPKKDKIFDIPRNYNQDFTTHHYDRVKTAEHKRKLQESQQKMSMQRERKRRRIMGTDFFNNGGSTQ